MCNLVGYNNKMYGTKYLRRAYVKPAVLGAAAADEWRMWGWVEQFEQAGSYCTGKESVNSVEDVGL